MNAFYEEFLITSKIKKFEGSNTECIGVFIATKKLYRHLTLNCFRNVLNILNLLQHLWKIEGKEILQVQIIYKVPLLLSVRINPNLMPASTEGEGKYNYMENWHFEVRKLSECLSLVGYIFLLQMETLMLPAKPHSLAW